MALGDFLAALSLRLFVMLSRLRTEYQHPVASSWTLWKTDRFSRCSRGFLLSLYAQDFFERISHNETANFSDKPSNKKVI